MSNQSKSLSKKQTISIFMEFHKMQQEGYSRMQRMNDTELLDEVQVLEIFTKDLLSMFYNVKENEYEYAYVYYSLFDEEEVQQQVGVSS